MKTTTTAYSRVISEKPDPEPEAVFTSATPGTELWYDMQDSAVIELRKNEPTLPMWLVMRGPSWLVNFCFWVKGKLK